MHSFPVRVSGSLLGLFIFFSLLSSCEKKSPAKPAAPTNPRDVLARVLELEGRERVTRAIEEIEAYAASRLAGKPPTSDEVRLWAKWTELLLKASRPKEAAEIAQAILKAQPGSPAAQAGHLLASSAQGDHRQAIRIYQSLPPASLLKVLNIYSKTVLDAGLPKEAAAISAAALVRDPWLHKAYLVLGRALYRVGEARAAAKAFLERYQSGMAFRESMESVAKLELRGKEAQANLQRALAESERGRLYEAMVRYNQVIKKNPGSGTAYLELAELSIFLERPKDTVGVLKRLPQHAKVLRLLGEAHEALDDIEAARTAYREALEKDPEMVDVQERLSRLDAREERSKDASAEEPLEVVRRQVRERIRDKSLQKSVSELAYLAAAYHRSGKPEEARKLSLFLVRLQPEQPELRDNVVLHFDQPGDLFIRLWAIAPLTDTRHQKVFDTELASVGLDPVLVRRALRGEAVVDLE